MDTLGPWDADRFCERLPTGRYSRSKRGYPFVVVLYVYGTYVTNTGTAPADAADAFRNHGHQREHRQRRRRCAGLDRKGAGGRSRPGPLPIAGGIPPAQSIQQPRTQSAPRIVQNVVGVGVGVWCGGGGGASCVVFGWECRRGYRRRFQVPGGGQCNALGQGVRSDGQARQAPIDRRSHGVGGVVCWYEYEYRRRRCRRCRCRRGRQAQQSHMGHPLQGLGRRWR